MKQREWEGLKQRQALYVDGLCWLCKLDDILHVTKTYVIICNWQTLNASNQRRTALFQMHHNYRTITHAYFVLNSSPGHFGEAAKDSENNNKALLAVASQVLNVSSLGLGSWPWYQSCFHAFHALLQCLESRIWGLMKFVEILCSSQCQGDPFDASVSPENYLN